MLHALPFHSVLVLLASVHGMRVQERCAQYEPDTVTVSGFLTDSIYAGPPEFESVARGDAPERVLLLVLDRPLCVQADSSSEVNNEAERGILRLQVFAYSENTIATQQLDSLARTKTRVRLRGTLFHAVTAHHRTPVLMVVTQVRGVR